MPKFSRRRFSKSVSRDKYSVERTAVSIQTPVAPTSGLYQATQLLVPATNVGGMRKVKHLTVSLTTDDSSRSLWWAVVFVPEGYSVNPLNGSTGASFYEPNQFVMAAGCNDPNAGPIRIRSPLSRNLNAGDSIWLVVGTNGANQTVQGIVQYAITLQ